MGVFNNIKYDPKKDWNPDVYVEMYGSIIFSFLGKYQPIDIRYEVDEVKDFLRNIFNKLKENIEIERTAIVESYKGLKYQLKLDKNNIELKIEIDEAESGNDECTIKDKFTFRINQNSIYCVYSKKTDETDKYIIEIEEYEGQTRKRVYHE